MFLDSADDIIRSIEYAEQNPVKDGLPCQNWPFVSKYDPMAVYTTHQKPA